MLSGLTLTGGLTYTMTRNSRGHVQSWTNPLGQRVDISYDPVSGDVRSIRDPRGNTVTFESDARGNQTRITAPDGSTETSRYDALGNMTERTNRRGETVRFTYDALGQLTRKDYPIGLHHDFTYDARGNLLTATDESGITSLEYDPAGRIVKITYPTGRFLTYSYEAAGRRRTRMVDQDGFTQNYTYDTAGRLTSVTDLTGNPFVTYSYDTNGHVVRRDMGNATSTTYQFDPADELVSVVHRSPTGTEFSRFDHTYDSLGRRTTVAMPGETWTYAYDASGQLVQANLGSANTIRYAYDAAGNRTSVVENGVTTAYTTNSLNEYVTVGNSTYAYDRDGNLTSRVRGTDTWQHAYDVEGRLVQIVGPDGTRTYDYDALGNRIATIHNGQRTEYLIDPFASVLSYVVGEYGSTSATTARYVHGLDLTSRVDLSGNAAYYHFDGSANTTELTDPTGAVLNRYRYEPFGELVSMTGTTPNPFTFSGEYGVSSDGNGLYHMRNRDFDPETGQFTSEDPLGLLGGDFNFRRYVSNEPITSIDPLGLGFWKKKYLADKGGWVAWGLSVGWALDPIYDSLNIQTVHEQYFFDDGTNTGFFPGTDLLGKSGSNGANGSDTGDAPYYYFDDYEYFDDALMKEAIEYTKESFTDNDYFLIPTPLSSNCQSWATKVRENYYAFLKIKQELQKEMPWIYSRDPNDIVGPNGFGPEGFLTTSATLPYTVRFENQASATAPAQQVVVTQSLDADLDLATFELGDIGFGNTQVTVPAGQTFFSTRVADPNSSGLFVDITASLNTATRVVTWDLRSADPATGDFPIDPFAGFLPPNSTSPTGEGFASYRIRSRTNLTTGTRLDAQARIVFDTNAPIDTPAIFNTIDTGVPISTVATLSPTVNTTTFPITWSGTDDTDGSGIATFDIHVSDNGGPFTLFRDDVAVLTTNFTGQPGHTYGFFSVATDHVGLRQDVPAAAQTSTTIVPDTDGDGVLDSVEDSGPNSGDANNDGVPDRQQAGVTTLRTTTGSHATLATQSGRTLTNVRSVTTPNPNGPAGVSYPTGFFSYEVHNVPTGSSTTVSLTLPAGTTPDSFWKFGRTPVDTTPHWYRFTFDGTTGAVIQGNVITLRLVDGGRGDDDLVANGIIADPGAPAVSPHARMYRLYNDRRDAHFFTLSAGEFSGVQQLGYRDESSNNSGFDVATTLVTGSSPIHRMYNPVGGQHYYTLRDNERDALVAFGWRHERDEGFMYTTQEAGSTLIHHLYNTTSGSHLYTQDSQHRDAILRNHPGIWEEHQSLGYAFDVPKPGLPSGAARRAAASSAEDYRETDGSLKSDTESGGTLNGTFTSTPNREHRGLLTPGISTALTELHWATTLRTSTLSETNDSLQQRRLARGLAWGNGSLLATPQSLPPSLLSVDDPAVDQFWCEFGQDSLCEWLLAWNEAN
jgi:RHS repeat-associated protein